MERLRDVAPLLCAADEILARRAAALAARWLATLGPTPLVRLDASFRCCAFVHQPLARPWSTLSPAALGRLARDGALRVPLIKLASFHASGFVRERAVCLLDELETGEELPFLWLRANDWVRSIRRAARGALERRLRAGRAQDFVGILPLLLCLPHRGRDDLDALVQRILGLVSAADGGQPLLLGLRSRDAATRLACFQALTMTCAVDRLVVLRAATQAPDPMLRLAAVRAAKDVRADDALRDLMSRWRHDASAAVRREALLLLLTTRSQDETRQALHDSIFDPNASMRALARFHLGRLGVGNFARVYCEALRAPCGPSTAAALRGLGETGGREHAPLALAWLERPELRVQRAALRALSSLDGEHHVARLVQALGSAPHGVSREARDALLTRVGLVGADALAALVEGSPHVHVQLNALTLVNRLSRWEALPHLVRACDSPTAAVARRAQHLVERWAAEHSQRFFTRPTPSQLARLRSALATASDRVPAALQRSLASVSVP